jgi:predicted metal-binding membrane protein
LLVFVGGWMVMAIAMMLPTSLPFLVLFGRLVRGRPDSPGLIALLVAGYLGIWTIFGLVIHVVDLSFHEAVGHGAWLTGNAWILGAAPLLLAGAYQFSRLKYICLERCRSPLSFITEHWHGRHARIEALQLGIHHGLFCLGCCWSLMLLMFAVGVGSLGWMLALAAVMAVEKNMPWGRRLSAPLGVGLLAWGFVLIVGHAFS